MQLSRIRYITTWAALAVLILSGIWLIVLSWNGIVSGQPHRVLLVSAWILICASGIYLFLLAVKKAHRQLVDETRALEKTAAKNTQRPGKRREPGREKKELDFAATARKLVRRTPESSSLEEAGELMLKNLSRELEIMAGVFYIRKKGKFVADATYAMAPHGEPYEFREGEGLTGQVALNKELVVMTRLPEDHLEVYSGLGKARPAYLAIVPFVRNGKSVAVLECAGYKYESSEIGNMFRIFARDLMEKVTSNRETGKN